MIGDFHFLRPWWLLALVPLTFVVWAIWRRQDATQAWRGIVAPHLLPFLLSGQAQRGKISPLLFIALGWTIAVLAIAGPTWRREPAPFADNTAALAIVIKVAPSMMTEDVQPTRLARGVQKIHDLLAQRRGAKTALIAYAGTAHVVMPATTDNGIIDTFAQALEPKIMPEDGDVAADALRLADQALVDAGGGSILWITDGIAPEQIAPLAGWRAKSSTAVRLLPPLLPGPELDALTKAAAGADANLVRLAADDSDVAKVARAAKFAAVASGELSDRWQESGYWLTPLLAAALLPFFRKGWMVQTAARG
jgi:Ca-activated chloride channel family protein